MHWLDCLLSLHLLGRLGVTEPDRQSSDVRDAFKPPAVLDLCERLYSARRRVRRLRAVRDCLLERPDGDGVRQGL